jgi:hypothetical protein
MNKKLDTALQRSSKIKTRQTDLVQDQNHLIVTIRGQKVILDADLARLYGVITKTLNQAVKRNSKRFPEPFMFQLTEKEHLNLRSQFVTSSRHGGRRYLPYVFTEHGVLMAANVLNSTRAITMSVEIILAFVRLRRLALSVEDLAKKVNTLERGFQQHGKQIKVVFDAIRKLMAPPDPPRKKIGFRKD